MGNPAPNSYAALGLTLPGPRSNIIRLHTPRASSGPAPRQTRNETRAAGGYYEALNATQDRTPIPLITPDFRNLLKGYSRERLAALGQYLYDNYGRVSYAVDTVANYSAPITPQSASPNPEWNKLADLYFSQWAKRADFSGRFDFWKLQRFMCKSSDTDGDIGALGVSESGFFQLQLIDGWRIRNRAANLKNNNDGAIVDAKGRLTGWWIDQPNGAISVSSNQLFLFGDHARYCDYRCMSPLRRGSNDIRDTHDIKAFEKIATKIGSALSAVIETEGGAVEEDVWGNDNGDPDGESPGNQPPDDATQQEKQFSIAELLGGDIPVLNEGEKLHQIDNKRPGAGVVEFLSALIGEFICGLGLPPAFYLDEKLTGPNSRSVNVKAQRHFDNRQADLARFVEWVRLRVIGEAIAIGELPSQEGFELMEWNGPAKHSIDLGEMAQEREDVLHGLMTEQQLFANRSLTQSREKAQWFAERRATITEGKKMADELQVPLEYCLPNLGTKAAQKQDQSDDGGRKNEQDKK